MCGTKRAGRELIPKGLSLGIRKEQLVSLMAEDPRMADVHHSGETEDYVASPPMPASVKVVCDPVKCTCHLESGLCIHSVSIAMQNIRGAINQRITLTAHLSEHDNSTLSADGRWSSEQPAAPGCAPQWVSVAGFLHCFSYKSILKLYQMHVLALHCILNSDYLILPPQKHCRINTFLMPNLQMLASGLGSQGYTFSVP